MNRCIHIHQDKKETIEEYKERLDLTKDNRFTYCKAVESKIGRGECHHIERQKADVIQGDNL